MKTETFILRAEDNVELFIYSWAPDVAGEAKGVIQIAHGMAEHGARYQDFARYMVAAGYAVFVNDHRGHGKTAVTVENTGFFAGENKWQRVLSDMHLLNYHIRQTYNGLPVVMLGHSMGSFYTRAYLNKYPETISGIILSGTAWHPAVLLNFGLLVAKMQSFFAGEKKRSKLLDGLSFGAFNKKFKPNKTPFDWLSRDEVICKKYTGDVFCGWVGTSSFFRELFRLLKYIHQPGLYQNVNKKLPVLVFSGEEDPVGNFSKSPKKMYAFLNNRGFSNTTLTLYPKGRHEMLNELNRTEVYNNISDWLGINCNLLH
ncbi:MAG TPA: lysophospholipase [Bacteroidales bacterium]|nr:lysophospholipase [Bacteroidales bacterium]